MRPRFLFAVLAFLPICAGFCQPGCTCFDEGRNVRCDKANLTTFPYMLNPMLKSLSLVDCKLKMLDSASISVYQELEFLDLSFNAIEELPSQFLIGFQRLRQVKLQGNRIRLISDDLFKDLPNLENLDLSSNKIERIMDNAFVELKSLISLNLSTNSIETISPKIWNGLSDLSELDLSKNRLEILTKDAFLELNDLAFLTLTNNGLKNVPRFVFMKQKKLVKLDLSKNKIESIEEGGFSGLHSLKSIDLSQNGLTDISSRNWPYLAELENLDLSENRFSSIYAGFFEGLASLRTLTLAKNEDLQGIELNGFAGVSKLTTIKIHDCPHLAFIDEYAFEHPNQIREVFLSNNALATISANLFNWRQLTKFDIFGNPWNCDCNLIQFLPEAMKTTRKMTDGVETKPICSLPEKLRGIAVDAVPILGCSVLNEKAIFLFSIVGAVVFLIIVLTFAAFFKKSKCCATSDKEKNLSNAPLYTGGSSFTDSLTYDKTDPMLIHRQTTLPIIKQSSHYGNAGLPQDYYSQILLLPPNAGTLPINRNYGFGDDACPYATGNIIRSDNFRTPSFCPPPPPASSIPIAPKLYLDAFRPVPSTEL